MEKKILYSNIVDATTELLLMTSEKTELCLLVEFFSWVFYEFI